MDILKKITDFIYGTERVKQKYANDFPDENIVAADASKGILTMEDKEIKRGPDWVTSQRAVVLLTDKRIKCGRWDLPLENISAAELVQINTTFGPGQVLKIKTNEHGYFQFGMQMNREWTDQQVLPLTLQKQKLKHSLFSIAVRLLLFGFLIYWIVEKINALIQ